MKTQIINTTTFANEYINDLSKNFEHDVVSVLVKYN